MMETMGIIYDFNDAMSVFSDTKVGALLSGTAIGFNMKASFEPMDIKTYANVARASNIICYR